MMPINKAYSIAEVIEACKYYIEKTNRRITFEYALVDGVNDSLEDAGHLAKLLKGMLCHVNLIPINKIKDGIYEKSSVEKILSFRDFLNDKGIVATVRRELGSDISAACGQLVRQEKGEE
jgi:23S rRNA (adenine2503-C2)-methyltransferase